MKWKYIIFAVYSIVIALLLASVIHSGYSYLFDPDELSNINHAFLLKHFLVPYRDFYTTYTPLLAWVLTPISYLTGFTFRLLEAARSAMIVLFIIRLILIFFIARKLFGTFVAYMSVPLYLFDPFTVFSGMQVRPDNLMLTFYLAGILLILHWYEHKKTSNLPWAGLLLGASVVTLLKNVPATFFVTLFVCIALLKTRNYRDLTRFAIAMMIPAAFFAIWALYKGIFPSMIQQLVLDPKQLNDILRFPQNILNYYWPPNFVLYGFPGRPITWAYEICLPFMAFAGIYTSFLTLKSFGTKHSLIGWFTAACLLQWVSLLFVKSVFIQYFLSVSWFLAVYAAFAISRVYEMAGTNSLYRRLSAIVGILLLVGGLMVSWNANNTRAKSSYAVQKVYLETQWRVIPETASVFPGALFRLSIYPLGYGINFVDLSGLIQRYGSPSMYLARSEVSYVVLDPYNFSFLDAPTQEYIRAHYTQNRLDLNMWIRQN